VKRLALLAAILLGAGTAPAAAQSYHDIADASAEADGFNGVMLVGKGGRIAAVEGFGRADAANGVPMLPNTRFETGSVSKWIASIVILKLVTRRSAATCPIIAPTPAPGLRCGA
jgi:CubicO group peptidase (beta-lactamase class C family)